MTESSLFPGIVAGIVTQFFEFPEGCKEKSRILLQIDNGHKKIFMATKAFDVVVRPGWVLYDLMMEYTHSIEPRYLRRNLDSLNLLENDKLRLDRLVGKSVWVAVRFENNKRGESMANVYYFRPSVEPFEIDKSVPIPEIFTKNHKSSLLMPGLR